MVWFVLHSLEIIWHFFLLYSNSPNFSELIQDFLFKKNASLAILVGSNDVLKHVISGV